MLWLEKDNQKKKKKGRGRELPITARLNGRYHGGKQKQHLRNSSTESF